MHRVELKEKCKYLLRCWVPLFLMHRVELKGFSEFFLLNVCQVPNAPCGVERYVGRVYSVVLSSSVPNAPYGVEIVNIKVGIE